MWRQTRWWMLGLVVLLSGCAQKHADRVTDAAVTPLSDLNMVRERIPAVLKAAQAQPYARPETQTCEALVAQIHALDRVLGADLDRLPTDDDPSLIDRGTDAAGDAAINALSRTAEGLIPFRGWVRKLSGAERHSRKVSAAITAGTARRAFLKGLASSQACEWQPARLQAVVSAQEVLEVTHIGDEMTGNRK